MGFEADHSSRIIIVLLQLLATTVTIKLNKSFTCVWGNTYLLINSRKKAGWLVLWNIFSLEMAVRTQTNWIQVQQTTYFLCVWAFFKKNKKKQRKYQTWAFMDEDEDNKMPTFSSCYSSEVLDYQLIILRPAERYSPKHFERMKPKKTDIYSLISPS